MESKNEDNDENSEKNQSNGENKINNVHNDNSIEILEPSNHKSISHFNTYKKRYLNNYITNINK